MVCLGKQTPGPLSSPLGFAGTNIVRTSWDGVEGTIDDKNDWNRGYCTHSQLLFGTWHRPYLVLFEVSASSQ